MIVPLRKHELYANRVWPRWISDVKSSPHQVVFIHGIMGSELYDDANQNTRWVDTGIWHEVDNLEIKTIAPEGAIDSKGQMIYARSTVVIPVLGDYYAGFLSAVGRGRFNYDWRDAIGIEAQRLKLFLEALIANGQKKLRLVTHSMGGCVLLRLLTTSNALYDAIEQIVFIAPPFWGALKPIRIIESGTGSPADFIISNAVLKEAAASMPGLFNLLVAPPGVWPTNPGLEIPELEYPVRTGEDLYVRGSWTSRARWELRQPLLTYTRIYYEERAAQVQRAVAELGDRITVIVGVHGKTEYAARMTPEWDWILHSVPEPPEGKYSNGDGTVLVQSAMLPGLDPDRYWAYCPPTCKDTHAALPNLPEVQNAVLSVLSGGTPAGSGLRKLTTIVPNIDWSHEKRGAALPKPFEYLDYLERARLRALAPLAQWGNELNPNGDDDRVFHATRTSALRVLNGLTDVHTEAKRLDQTPEFVKNHIQTYVAPILFG